MDEYLVPLTVAGITATITVEAKNNEVAAKKINKFLQGLRKGVREIREDEPERV